ncbi:hypothetical protein CAUPRSCDRAFT_10843 [Caulochytrium protostelioides]|nr:hypothetical protein CAUPRSCDRAFT_10843 [Caulochytrium protostelioides]
MAHRHPGRPRHVPLLELPCWPRWFQGFWTRRPRGAAPAAASPVDRRSAIGVRGARPEAAADRAAPQASPPRLSARRPAVAGPSAAPRAIGPSASRPPADVSWRGSRSPPLPPPSPLSGWGGHEPMAEGPRSSEGGGGGDGTEDRRPPSQRIFGRSRESSSSSSTPMPSTRAKWQRSPPPG